MAIGNTTLCTFEGTDTTDFCFDSSSNVTVQKIRQCDQDETPFTVLLLAVVVVFNLVSLLATLRLNKIINYLELYKSSKSLLGCKTQPILHRAAVFQLINSDRKEDVELFDEIFQDGKDLSTFINRPNSSGRTPLYNACERQSPKKVSQLLSAGANINQAIANGQTPLHIACEKKSAEISLKLLNAEANILPDTRGKEPKMVDLLIALIDSEKEEDALLLTKFLEGKKVSTFINQTTTSGQTALHIACEKQSTEVVFKLLNAGAGILHDAEWKEPKVTDLLLAPLIKSDKEDDALLLTKFLGVNNVSTFINQKTSTGQTALHIACEKQSLGHMSQLLDAGADINQKTATGQTAMHIACEKQSTEVVFKLLNAGAKLLRDSEGKEPKVADVLIGLIESDKEDDALLLTKFLGGKNVSDFINQKTATGQTALPIACDEQSPRKVVQLLKAGAEVMKPEWEKHYLALVLENSDRPEDQELVETIEIEIDRDRDRDRDLHLHGIRHTVEEPELVKLLRTWNSAEDITEEEAEQRVVEKFVQDTKVLTIPLSADMEREEMKEMVRKWNSNHTTKCEYLTIGINLKQKDFVCDILY